MKKTSPLGILPTLWIISRLTLNFVLCNLVPKLSFGDVQQFCGGGNIAARHRQRIFDVFLLENASGGAQGQHFALLLRRAGGGRHGRAFRKAAAAKNPIVAQGNHALKQVFQFTNISGIVILI